MAIHVHIHIRVPFHVHVHFYVQFHVHVHVHFSCASLAGYARAHYQRQWVGPGWGVAGFAHAFSLRAYYEGVDCQTSMHGEGAGPEEVGHC